MEALQNSDSLDPAIVGWLQELAPEGILITDCDLRVRGWNHWLEVNSGRKASDAIGKLLPELFPELSERRLIKYFDLALKGQVCVLSSALHGYLLELPPPLANLGFKRMQQTARIAPLMCEGTVCGTITSIEDVTQRTSQARELRKQHEVAELLSWALAELLQTDDPEAFLERLLPRVARHVGAETFIVYLVDQNTGLTRLHSSHGLSAKDRARFEGTSAAEALGTAMPASTDTIVVPDTADPGAKGVASVPGIRSFICHPLFAGKQLLGTFLFGSRTPNRLNPNCVEIVSTIAQYSALALDRARRAAELRTAQTALQRHATDLEGRVRQRTAELSELVSDLESFSYTIAHDLRAPLRHLSGYAKALLEDHVGELSPTAHQYVTRIQKATRRMDELTRDLLQYSTVARTEMRSSPVALQTVLDSLREQLPAVTEPGVVTIETPLHSVMGNQTLLQQCLLNLLQNAIKFVARGTEPRIRVYTRQLAAVSNAGTPSVRIFVEDNGIGIDPEARQKIFGVFERAVRPTEYEGTGIGLAIVAKAMQKMGGRFGVESQIGVGSAFWLELPAAPEEAPRPAQAKG